MDRMLFLAMSGAKQTMQAQTVNANNLANVNTTGFRADLAAMRSMPLYGAGLPSRVFAMTEKPGADFTHGALTTTGRELDIAIKTEGWVAVQGADGKEAYTRAGDLQITTAGLLQTGAGHPVLGESGPISLPSASKIDIGGDGTISIIPMGAESAELRTEDRIKLVNPDKTEIYKGNDGLFRLKDGNAANADANVRVVSGSLETSNVNVAEALVNMIELARKFEMQTKMMRVAEENDQKAAQIMQLS